MESNSDELSRGADDTSSSDSEEESVATTKRNIGGEDDDDDDDDDDGGKTSSVRESDEEGLSRVCVKVEVQEVDEQAEEYKQSQLHQTNKRKLRTPKQYLDSDYDTDWKRPKRKKAKTCPDCGKVFENAGEMKKHAVEHQVQTRHKCVECGRCFSKAYGLKAHSRMHGEKNQHCPMCEASFTQPTNLTGQRPSEQQRKLLVKFLERNPDLATGPNKSSWQNVITRRKWDRVAGRLNELGIANKDGRGWAKYWTEKKCHLKKLCKKRDTSKLTDLEIRLAMLIDKSIAAKMTQTLPGPIKSDDEDSDFLSSLTDEESGNEESEVSLNKSEDGSKTIQATGLRPSYEQVQKLVEFLVQHPAIAQSKYRTAHAIMENRRKWASWAETLNALGMAKKDGPLWCKYWTEKKCFLKKVAAKQETHKISELERKMLEVIDLDIPDDITLYYPRQVNEDASEVQESEAEKDEEIDWQVSYKEDLPRSKKRPTTKEKPSPFQVERLLDFLECNPKLAQAKYKTLEGRMEAKKQWAAIAETLNPLGEAQRDGPGWAKYWTEKKCYMRKYFGYEDPEKMTPLEIRMMALSKDNINTNSTENCPQQNEPETKDTTQTFQGENTLESVTATREEILEDKEKFTQELAAKNEEDTLRPLESAFVESTSYIHGTKSLPLESAFVNEPPCEVSTENYKSGSRISADQLLKLVKFLESNWNIANGSNRTDQGRKESKDKWAQLAISLNAMDGVKKSGVGWSKYWTEKKCYLKKLYASKDVAGLSTLEKRMLRIVAYRPGADAKRRRVKSNADTCKHSADDDVTDTGVASTSVVVEESDPLDHRSEVKVNKEVGRIARQSPESESPFTAPYLTESVEDDSDSSNEPDEPKTLTEQMSELTHAISESISAIRSSTAVIRSSALLIERRTDEINQHGIREDAMKFMSQAVKAVTDGVAAIRENTQLVHRLREMTK